MKSGGRPAPAWIAIAALATSACHTPSTITGAAELGTAGLLGDEPAWIQTFEQYLAQVCPQGVDRDEVTYENEFLIGAWLDNGKERVPAEIAAQPTGVDTSGPSPVLNSWVIFRNPAQTGSYLIYAPLTPFVVLANSITQPSTGQIPVNLSFGFAPVATKVFNIQTSGGQALPANTPVTFGSPTFGASPAVRFAQTNSGLPSSAVALNCVNVPSIYVFIDTGTETFDGEVDLTAGQVIYLKTSASGGSQTPSR